MSTDYVPPRPDGMFPGPAVPPIPGDPPPPATDERPKATWSWWQALGMYVLAFFAGGFAALPVISAIDDEGLATIASSAFAALVILGILVLWLQNAHPTWRAVMGLPPRDWAQALLRGFGAGLLLYPAIVFLVGAVLSLLYQAVSGHPVQAPEQIPSHLSAVGIVLTVVYAIVIAPIGEEFFFRGMLFGSLRDRFGFWPGAIGSGIAFGLIHYVPGPALDSLLLMSVMVFTGMGLAWIYQRRETIVAPMAAHMAFNVIGLLLIYTLR
jgi:uncharacterized protein